MLAEAIRRTFKQRRTQVPADLPPALTEAFAAAKQGQWAAFLKRTEIALAPEPFPEVQARIAGLVMLPAMAIARSEPFESRWPPSGPWDGR